MSQYESCHTIRYPDPKMLQAMKNPESDARNIIDSLNNLKEKIVIPPGSCSIIFLILNCFNFEGTTSVNFKSTMLRWNQSALTPVAIVNAALEHIS